ncbi:MAG: zf-HC2 domain-containing protein [Tepidisphaeraceae bacterium]|jgi:anti-sigma factor RsiW
MADCEFQNSLMAYSDGQLDEPSRAQVERHLQECPACAAELAQLRALSRNVGAVLAAQPGLSQIARHRLHAKLDSVMDDGILRAARFISAIAACVLAGCSIWLVRGHQLSPAPPPWVDVASQSDTSIASSDNTSPAAVWYLASATNRPDELP